MIEGLDVRDPSIRVLDQSRIGPILDGDRDSLVNGPPVNAMLVQNTNPMCVAPDLNRVRNGLARDDLFVCVHEQFMTETAAMADIVLPATMFLEHDDVYQGGGHQHILLGPKIVDPPGECRSNHELVCGLADRLGVAHRGFGMSPRELIDQTLLASGWGRLEQLEEQRWFDCQPSFEESHYLNGFAHPDGKFRFMPDWQTLQPTGFVDDQVLAQMPVLPDHWPVTEEATAEHPYRLITAPARQYLNSTFTESSTSIRREGRPTVMVHPEDAEDLGIRDGDLVRLSNARGVVFLHARKGGGMRRGVLIVESIWPNRAFEGGIGINALTGADAAAPVGGAAFHDNHVRIAPVHATARGPAAQVQD